MSLLSSTLFLKTRLNVAIKQYFDWHEHKPPLTHHSILSRLRNSLHYKLSVDAFPLSSQHSGELRLNQNFLLLIRSYSFASKLSPVNWMNYLKKIKIYNFSCYDLNSQKLLPTFLKRSRPRIKSIKSLTFRDNRGLHSRITNAFVPRNNQTRHRLHRFINVHITRQIAAL